MSEQKNLGYPDCNVCFLQCSLAFTVEIIINTFSQTRLVLKYSSCVCIVSSIQLYVLLAVPPPIQSLSPMPSALPALHPPAASAIFASIGHCWRWTFCASENLLFSASAGSDEVQSEALRSSNQTIENVNDMIDKFETRAALVTEEHHLRK
jgi:hypothetical protein